MSLEKCPRCGRMHYRTDPCRVTKLADSPIAEKGSKPKSDPLGKIAGHNKSTAARKDVRILDPRAVTPLQQPKREQRKVTAGSTRVEGQSVSAGAPKANAPTATAGTQAPARRSKSKAAVAAAPLPASDDNEALVNREPGSVEDVRGVGFDPAQNGAATSGALTQRGTPRQRAPKGTFDRKAWQRDYQRKRRSKEKT